MPKPLSEYSDEEIREVEAYFDIVKSNYASETIMSKAVYISLACMQTELDRRKHCEILVREFADAMKDIYYDNVGGDPSSFFDIAEALAKEFRFTRRT